MRLDVRAVDGDLLRRPRQRRRQFGEHILPDAFLGPTVITIEDRCRGTVFRWAVPPAATRLKHMDAAADNPPAILAPLAGRPAW